MSSYFLKFHLIFLFLISFIIALGTFMLNKGVDEVLFKDGVAWGIKTGNEVSHEYVCVCANVCMYGWMCVYVCTQVSHSQPLIAYFFCLFHTHMFLSKVDQSTLSTIVFLFPVSLSSFSLSPFLSPSFHHLILLSSTLLLVSSLLQPYPVSRWQRRPL
jgi:GDP dissociation inhibitor